MTQDLVVVLVKALLGGLMVSVFAVVGHLLRPKWFAGLFGAAPAVAVASLAVTVVAKGRPDAAIAGYAMIFGAVGFVAYGSCVRPLLTRTHAVVASSLSCLVWIVVAVGGYLVVAR